MDSDGNTGIPYPEEYDPYATALGGLSLQMHSHEQRSQERYEELRDSIQQTKRGDEMGIDSSDKVYGGGDSGLLAAALLSGGLNNRRDDNCDATQAALTSAIADGINHNINNLGVGVNHNINTSLQGLTNLVNNGFGGSRDLTTMGKLCDIEKGVWQAEGQVQLAIAGAQSDINNRIGDALQTAIQGQGAIRKDISDAISASLLSQGDIKQTVAQVGATTIAATKDAQFTLSREIRDDGDKTRELITRQYEDTLNRELSEARNALVELRSAGRVRESEINITNTNTANAQQLQLQTQQQQQLQFMAQLVSEVRNLANDVQIVRQSQSNINFGVQGANTQGQAATNNRVS